MEELLLIGNPKRRRGKKRRSSGRKKKGFSGSGFMKRVSRRRSGGGGSRYSLRGLIGSPVSTLKPAFTGAVGAILVNSALNLAVSRIPVVGTLMVGRVRYVTQAVAAIGLAAVAQRFGAVGGATAAKMAEGALTVTMVDAIRDLAGQFGVPLSGGMGYYLPGYSAGAAPSYAAARPAQMAGGMGKYISGPGAAPSVVPFRRSALGGGRGMGNSTSFGLGRAGF